MNQPKQPPLSFKAWCHLQNNQPQTREQKQLTELKSLAYRNQNKLLILKMRLDNAK